MIATSYHEFGGLFSLCASCQTEQRTLHNAPEPYHPDLRRNSQMHCEMVPFYGKYELKKILWRSLRLQRTYRLLANPSEPLQKRRYDRLRSRISVSMCFPKFTLKPPPSGPQY